MLSLQIRFCLSTGFFGCREGKIHSAHDRPRPRFRLTLLSDLVCILSLRGRPREYVFEESPPDKGACTFTKPVSSRLRAQVLERNGYTCQMCGIGAGDILAMAEKQGCMLDISLTEATAAQKHWATSGHCAATATRAQSTLDLNHPPTHGSSV